MPHPKLLIVPLAALLLSACVVAPYPRSVYPQPVPYGQPSPYGQPVPYGQSAPYYDGGIAIAPPAPYVEVVPALPFLGALWISGFWGWDGGRHHWNPGRWDRGRPGYSWRPHAWEQRGNRWHQRGGGWTRGR